MKNIVAALAFIRGNQQLPEPVKLKASVSVITDMDLYEEEWVNVVEKKYGKARRVLVIHGNNAPTF